MKRLSRPFALLLLATSLCARLVIAATAADGGQPVTASFAAFWAAAQGRPFAQQEALWDRYIEQPRAKLYRSVVWEVRDNPQWRSGRERMLQARFAQYPQVAAEIPAEAGEIEAQLRAQTVRFRQLFPSAAGAPRAVIVLAPDFDAKSGVLPDGTPVLALAADTLALEKADLRILLPHELFHLYDAEHAGLQNDGVMPDTRLTLPLFAEGLATYVSSVASPGRSDGQYLFQSNLGALPSSRLPAAARDFLRVANTLTIDPKGRRMSPLYAQWFEGGRTSLNPGYPNRAGYWLGLNLIRQLRRTCSLQQLASWSPAEAQRRARAELAEMARRRQGTVAACARPSSSLERTMRRRDSVVAADPEIRVLAVVEARRVSELHVVFIPEAAESFAVQSARERAAVHVFVVTAITTAADYAMLG